MTEPNTLDEYGEVRDLSDVKIPPQIKGKLEYHSTPNIDTLDEQIDAIMLENLGDTGWNGSLLSKQYQTAKQQLKTLFTEHSKEVDRLARIDEVEKAGAIYGYFAGDREFNQNTELPIIHVNGYPQKEEMYYRRSELAEKTLRYLKIRLTQLSKRNKGENNE